MPWCPKCKNEYVEGITECADCHTMLVDELAEEEELATLLFAEEELAKELASFLEYSKIKGVEIRYSGEYSMFEVLAPKSHEREAMKYTAAFRNTKEEMLKDAAYEPVEGDADAPETAERTIAPVRAHEKSAYPYVKKEEKHKEMISSAYTFLIIGILGLVVLALVAADVISLNLADASKYLIYIVMGLMFLIFLVIAFYSFRSAKVLAKEAVEENELTNHITEWFLQNFNAEAIDAEAIDAAGAGTLPDEAEYFRRCALIKELITQNYGELDEAYLDKLADEFHQKLFEAVL